MKKYTIPLISAAVCLGLAIAIVVKIPWLVNGLFVTSLGLLGFFISKNNIDVKNKFK